MAHTLRPGEDDPRDGIGLHAGRREPGHVEQREVRPLAGFDRAQVVAPEARGATAGAETQGLARRHGTRPAAAARHEQGLAHLPEQVATVIRGGPVHADAHGHPRIDELPDRGGPGAEAQVRGGAVRDGGPGPGDQAHVLRDRRRRHGPPDGSNRIASTWDVPDIEAFEAAQTAASPDMAAAMERYGMIPPTTIDIEK